jgi:hypothetical protein
MRDYLSATNLGKALLLSALCTAASVPRIVQGGLDARLFVPAAFLSLTLIAGVATAWSTCAGMAGLWPDRRQQLHGMGIAILAALILWPVALKFDPFVRAAFAARSTPQVLILQYPDSAAGVAALVLWSASFELLFFVAASAAFFARLFNRKWAAIAGPVLARVVVAHYQLTTGGITDAVPLILLSTGIMTAAACFLLSRFGLAAATVFVAVMDSRLFFMMQP